jgi:5-methylcytosine-specific restriction endonuclease McrA
MSANLSRAVLVLNASYEPINIVSVQRAMVLIFKGAAVVQVASQNFIRTASIRVALPSVIRLLKYRSVPRHSRAVSRKNIMVRDQNTCQYCRMPFAPAKLTLDHVIPRSRGGRSTWENLAACCYPCNNRKGDRTPEEAGMVLLKKPGHFGMHARHKLLSADNDAWAEFLFT